MHNPQYAASDGHGPGDGTQARHQVGQQIVSIRGEDFMFVHLPESADPAELLKSRIRAIDHGRTQFTRRVRKKPQPKPVEKLAPIVSERITEAHDDG